MRKILLISSLLLTNLWLMSCSTESSEDLITPINNIMVLESPKPMEIEILEEINAYRLTKNLPVLLHNEQIRTQTQNHTYYMIKNNSASHDNFFSRKEYLTTHANALEVSENVAAGFTNARSVVKAWINSDTHRMNIEGDHTHFNITAEKDSNDKWYYTNIFIKKID